MTDMQQMLRTMYGVEFSDDELNALIQGGMDSDLSPILGEIKPMHDPETGQFYLYSQSKSVVADLQRYFTERGATGWFDQRPIHDPDEREAQRLADGDIAYEIRLSDTLGQVEYRKNFKDLASAGYPVDQLIEALGPAPRPTVTIAVGRFLASESLDMRYRMTPADYAVKRGMRRAAELRMPTTGAARVSANLKRLSEIDAIPAPANLEWAGVAIGESLDHEQRATLLGRNDDQGLI